MSVTDVERSKAFYSRMLGGAICWQSQPDAEVQGATLRLPDCFIGLFKLGEPKIHHFCVGVERFVIDSAVEKLKRISESRPLTYRGRSCTSTIRTGSWVKCLPSTTGEAALRRQRDDAVPSAPGVAGVRVREVMSRGPGPRTGAPPPEGVDVGYPLGSVDIVAGHRGLALAAP